MTETFNPRWCDLAERIVPTVIVGTLGIIVLVDAAQLRDSVGYSVIGPRVFPAIAGVGLLVAAILLAASKPTRPDDAGPTRWWRLLGAIATLLGFASLVNILGMAVAAAIFLPIQARVLGSRAPIRDIVTGIIAGVILQLVFGQLLGLAIPAGVLQPLLELGRPFEPTPR